MWFSRTAKPNPIPPEMQRKLDKILEMDLDQLNDAYVEEMARRKIPITSDNQPDAAEIYKVLIPELFELAERVKRQRQH